MFEFSNCAASSWQGIKIALFAVMSENSIDVRFMDAEHLSDFHIRIFLALNRSENSNSEI